MLSLISWLYHTVYCYPIIIYNVSTCNTVTVAQILLIIIFAFMILVMTWNFWYSCLVIDSYLNMIKKGIITRLAGYICAFMYIATFCDMWTSKQPQLKILNRNLCHSMVIQCLTPNIPNKAAHYHYLKKSLLSHSHLSLNH